MIQAFSSQLIPGEVGSEITASNRPEIQELSLDQNFNSQSGINYVGLSVPGDLSLNRGIYNTVSLPQTIVSAMDQNQEGLASVYVPTTDHLLDKHIPINQAYPPTVNGILSLGTVVTQGGESALSMQEVSPISADVVDKPQILRSLKISFASRSYDTLAIADIPNFLKEYADLRRAFSVVNKEEEVAALIPLNDPSNPPLSLLPQLLDEYKMMVQNMRKAFICTTCHKSFTTRHSLSTHMSIHNNVKPYECPHAECGKFFRTKSALNTHINLVHTTEKEHICSSCGKQFSKVWLLRQHEIRHHANHRYHCSKCNLTFTYPYQLKQHNLNKHEGVKPYTCSYEGCNKQFPSKSTLHLHELAHTRSFVCAECFRSFGYACDLKRHMKKVHGL